MTLAVLSGAIAGVIFAVVEVIWLRAAIPEAFPPFGGALGLLTAMVPRGFVAGAALGLAQGLYLSFADWVSRRGRWREDAAFAALAAAPLVVGAIAAIGPSLVRGQHARSLTDHPLLLAVLGATLTWCLYELVLVVRRVPESVHAQASEPSGRAVRRRWISGGLIICAAATYVVDHLFLARLCAPFHLGLGFVAVALLELAILTACQKWPRRANSFHAPRWFGASVALVALGLAVAHAHDSTGTRRAALDLMRLRGAIGASFVSVTDALVRDWPAARSARPAHPASCQRRTSLPVGYEAQDAVPRGIAEPLGIAPMSPALVQFAVPPVHSARRQRCRDGQNAAFLDDGDVAQDLFVDTGRLSDTAPMRSDRWYDRTRGDLLDGTLRSVTGS